MEKKRFMNKWDEINCRTDCGLCNHKGAPSYSKGSKLCLQLRKEIPKDGIVSWFKKFKDIFNNKGKMRAFGKVKKKEIKNE